MVKSQLNPEINYDEPKNIHTADVNHNSDVYELELLGKTVEIVLGKEKQKDEISYYYVYLVLNQQEMRPVAVYEVKTSELSNVLDDDGDLDLDKMSGPLLFSNIDLQGSHNNDLKAKQSDAESDEGCRKR